jgi:hypothetical protein
MLGARSVPERFDREGFQSPNVDTLAGVGYTFDTRNTSGIGLNPGGKYEGPQGSRLKTFVRDYTGRGNYGPPVGAGKSHPGSAIAKGGGGNVDAPYGKVFQIRALARVARDIRPIHMPARKLFARQFTQPLQDIIGPFKRNRQQSLPGSRQASIAPHPQVAQPSVRRAGPQTNIPTGMPWNSPMVI